MELRIAKAISYIFHPLFIPFYTILYLLNSDSHLSQMVPFKGKLFLVGIITVTTVVLPLFTSFVLVRLKIIHSFFPEAREERIYLLLNVAIFYYLTYYLLKGTHVSLMFNYFMLGSTFLVICSMMVTFFHPVSLHMIAGGGLLGGLFGLSFGHSLDVAGYILVLVLLSGVVGSARLKTGSQKPAGVYLGFFIGIMVMFLLFILI